MLVFGTAKENELPRDIISQMKWFQGLNLAINYWLTRIMDIIFQKYGGGSVASPRVIFISIYWDQ